MRDQTSVPIIVRRIGLAAKARWAAFRASFAGRGITTSASGGWFRSLRFFDVGKVRVVEYKRKDRRVEIRERHLPVS